MYRYLSLMIYLCIYTYMCIYIYIFIHTYIYTFIYIYIHTISDPFADILHRFGCLFSYSCVCVGEFVLGLDKG